MNNEKDYTLLPNFTRFSHPLMDWLLLRSTELTKRELVVFLAVVRNTLGRNQKIAEMSCRYIQNATGISPSNVLNAVRGLQEKGFIEVSGEGGTTHIALGKGVPILGTPSVPELGTPPQSPVPESGTEPYPNQVRKCTQTGYESVPELGTNKDIDKKENKEEVTASPEPQDEFAGLF